MLSTTTFILYQPNIKCVTSLAVICKQIALYYWANIIRKQVSLMCKMFHEQLILYKNFDINQNLISWHATQLNLLNNPELEYALHDLKIVFIYRVFYNASVVHQWKNISKVSKLCYNIISKNELILNSKCRLC